MKNKVRSSCLFGAVVMLSGALPRPALAQAPRSIFAKVTANGSSISDGCSDVFGRIGGQDLNDHVVVLQAGASATTAGGRLALRPYKIVKPVDACSPLFFQAMAQAQLVNVDVKFFRPTPDGESEHFYSVRLQNAHISAITSAMSAPQTGSPDSTKEIVAFAFQSMTLVDHGTRREVVVSTPTH